MMMEAEFFSSALLRVLSIDLKLAEELLANRYNGIGEKNESNNKNCDEY